MKWLARMLGLFCGQPQTQERARSPKWESCRAKFLRDNNECAACGTVRELEVHHIVPYQLRPDMELNVENLITLCREDHFTFGHLKDWKSWNDKVRTDCDKYRAKVRKRP